MSDWSLGRLSEILEESSQKRRTEEDEAIARAKAGLPEYLASLKNRTGKDLLDRLLHHNASCGYGFGQRKEFAIIHRLARMRIKQELWRRLES